MLHFILNFDLFDHCVRLRLKACHFQLISDCHNHKGYDDHSEHRAEEHYEPPDVGSRVNISISHGCHRQNNQPDRVDEVVMIHRRRDSNKGGFGNPDGLTKE